MFKIKQEIIPKEAYIYRLRKIFENDKEIYRTAGRFGGIVWNLKEKEIITLLQHEDNEDIEFICKLPTKDINQKNIKEEITLQFLKRKYNLEQKIKRALISQIGYGIEGDYRWEPEPRFGVKIYKEDYYLVLDFHCPITSTQNLWGISQKNAKNLEKYIGKRVKYEKGGTYKIEEIKNDPKETERVIKYLKNKYKDYTSRDFDKNQPIIRVKNYSFIPETLFLIFRFEEVKGEAAKKLLEIFRFKNEERFQILEKAISSIEDIVHVDSLKSNGLKFKAFLVVKNVEGKHIEIEETNKLIFKKFHPFEVPDIVKGKEIKTTIFIDEEIEDDERSVVGKIIEFFRYYNGLRDEVKVLPYFNFKGNVVKFKRQNVESVVNSIEFNENLSFAFIVGKQKYENDDYYEKLKMLLFDRNIISQNVLWNRKTLVKDYALNNLIIQILSKFGVKYFALKKKIEYDYVLGVDISREKFSGSSVGGCTVIYDSEGKIRRIVPIEAPARGETLNLERVFDKLISQIDMKGKNILLLRDGSIKSEEKEQLKRTSKQYFLKITTLNIKKNHVFKIGNDEAGIGILLDDVALLLPHSYPFGSNPIKIDNKITFENGKLIEERIIENDLEILYALSKMNYSTLSSKERILKLPAPVHYAHKFVKALAKGWKLKEELLKEGCLYFI